MIILSLPNSESSLGAATVPDLAHMVQSPAMLPKLIIRHLPMVDYQQTWQQMQSFTQNRTADTPDELWLLQHPAVFTQGQAGKAEHILFAGDIPVVQTDRGGQVTYHGPGQLVAYVLFDLKRLGIGIRNLVTNLEQAIIDTLREYDINAHGRRDAPGVYVDQAKICSIGLRVKRGSTYHGIAFNINMDTSPFQRINPCGMANLPITQVRDFAPNISVEAIEQQLIAHIVHIFGYNGRFETMMRAEYESSDT